METKSNKRCLFRWLVMEPGRGIGMKNENPRFASQGRTFAEEEFRQKMRIVGKVSKVIKAPK